MARTKSALGAGARLSDYLSASLLARVVPAEQVHAVLNEHGCNTQRVRSFPAVAGVYYCMALSLYPEAAYEDVFAVVAQGLAWAAGAAEPVRVTKSSISALRSRICPASNTQLRAYSRATDRLRPSVNSRRRIDDVRCNRKSIDPAARCFINNPNPLHPAVQQHRIHYIRHITSRHIGLRRRRLKCHLLSPLR